MKHLNTYITEYIIKKKLDKPINSEDQYDYYPKTKEELLNNIKECLDSNNYDLNCINTSKITDMSSLFYNLKFEKINIDVSNWDVSNVKDMNHMFCNCTKFDCNLSKWNVSNVKDMQYMFDGCESFEGKGIENWDVSNVINMNYMFGDCWDFNYDLSKWNVSNVKDMSHMFYFCKNFEGKGLENWDVSKVEDTNYMFYDCKSLCCDLSSWKISKNNTNISHIFNIAYIPIT